jgi:hypothetical protein
LPIWNEEGRQILAPADFAEASFPYAGRLQRGFEPDAVRDFLRTAGNSVAWLMRECRRFEENADRLRQLVKARGNGEHAIGDEASIRAVHALARAQATADQTIRDQARHKAEELSAEAAQRGREAAEQALATAPTAGQQTAEELARQLAASRAELAYFKAHADVYRSHLRLMAEATIRSMDDWETREKTAVLNASRSAPAETPRASSPAGAGSQPRPAGAAYQQQDVTKPAGRTRA